MTTHPADPLDDERPCPCWCHVALQGAREIVTEYVGYPRRRTTKGPCDNCHRSECDGTGVLTARNPDAPKVIEVLPRELGGFCWKAEGPWSDPHPTPAAALKVGRLATCGCEEPCQGCEACSIPQIEANRARQVGRFGGCRGSGGSCINYAVNRRGFCLLHTPELGRCDGTGKLRNVCEVCRRVKEMPDA